MIKKADWLAIAKDRTAIMLMLGLAICFVVISVMTALRLHASDVQIPVRYTGYGTANIYRDQWYTLFSFPAFGALVIALNTYLAVKIYSLSRLMSLGLLGFSIFIVLLGLIIAGALFNLAPSV